MTDSQSGIERQPERVQEYFEDTVEQGTSPSDQQLVFDPATGELVVQSKEQPLPNPDATVADSIAEKGFFEIR